MRRPIPPDPGPPQPADLRRLLVLRSSPGLDSGLIPEAWFTPRAGYYIAGSFRIPGGSRIAVAVDPEMEPGTFRIENALTGEVTQRGHVGKAPPNLPPPDIQDRIARMRARKVP